MRKFLNAVYLRLLTRLNSKIFKKNFKIIKMIYIIILILLMLQKQYKPFLHIILNDTLIFIEVKVKIRLGHCKILVKNFISVTYLIL